MAKDPWTDPDPQPGDFDADLAAMGPEDVQIVEAGSGAKVRLLVKIDGEDAARLRQLASERGQDIDEVVADLVRDAA
jgi:hypothetical protein